MEIKKKHLKELTKYKNTVIDTSLPECKPRKGKQQIQQTLHVTLPIQMGKQTNQQERHDLV